MFLRAVAMILSAGLFIGAANASLNSWGLGADRDLRGLGTPTAFSRSPSIRTGSGSNGTTRRLSVK
ncbi:hypothetical protein [Jannaschia pohangensis]|uniref:Uncharacterized protein n=1 Tax=Jannaschia pohangensis TaxID=390807 RepID=A0A1I3RXB8_9RHOB|nr:hypothetical protein [Jannaschia pohangensis]SFJ51223.1 hypothetical protein SAMN04488095_2940 [Jannaschia pohangensis]